MKIKHLLFFAFGCIVFASCQKLQPEILPPGDSTEIDTNGTDTIPGDTVVEVQPICNGQPVLKWNTEFENISIIALASDTAGNVYLGCRVERDIAEVDADPGPGTMMVEGSGFIIIKMNQEKQVIWAKKVMAMGHPLDFFGGVFTKLVVDNEQRVYIAINWQHRQLGDRYNTYLIDTNGDIKPVFSNYGPTDPGGTTVVEDYDINGNVYSTSRASSWPYASTFAKYNLVTNTEGFKKTMEIAELVAAASGNIYTIGASDDKNFDFDDGPAVQHITLPPSVSGVYTYLLKLDPSGNFVWVKYVQGTFTPYNYAKRSVYLDNNENMYVSGQRNTNNQELLLKYNSSGAQLWNKVLDIYSGIVFDNANNWYTRTVGPKLTRFDGAGNPVWSVDYQGELITFKNNRYIYTAVNNNLYKYSLCE